MRCAVSGVVVVVVVVVVVGCDDEVRERGGRSGRNFGGVACLVWLRRSGRA
jgi:hypothetical protein